MCPVIGIILRKDVSSSGKKIRIVYDDVISAVIKSGGIPIMIPNDDIYRYLNMCNGFILQGGDTIDNNNLELLKVFTNKNIPILGICLGMQEMGVFDNGKLIDVSGHLNDGLHEIIINKDSLLYKIIGFSKILVNSRHKSVIKNTNLFVSSISSDNQIESIENRDLNFYLGLQWHPENMYNDDINARKIFDYFIKVCNDCIDR